MKHWFHEAIQSRQLRTAVAARPRAAAAEAIVENAILLPSEVFCAKGGFMKIVMQVGCWAGWLASATGLDSRPSGAVKKSLLYSRAVLTIFIMPLDMHANISCIFHYGSIFLCQLLLLFLWTTRPHTHTPRRVSSVCVKVNFVFQFPYKSK